ncbi:MAG: hypothetical protein KAZ71_03995 [Bacteroidia bacterium]|nr:hypothetical protein [Bacteroidia bacterium]
MATKSPAKKAMAKTAPSRILIKKKESILLKEISFIEKNMATYRAERKASWKTFKSKMEADINQIRKSIEVLTQTEE